MNGIWDQEAYFKYLNLNIFLGKIEVFRYDHIHQSSAVKVGLRWCI